MAQTCPTNIGFETGDLTGWLCYAGTIKGGNLILSATPPIPGRHTVVKNTSPQAKDPYGNFPVNCPNGSGYSLILGNSGIGAEAERVTYTFKIPDDKPNYTLIYYYAVVFQNPPGHGYTEQPAFTANVYNTADKKLTGCGSFNFVASANLEGFKQSPVSSIVLYKEWSPITLNLIGYQGKSITLEFTTNDCTRGGHFGYAYLDVNENCNKSPITGGDYCIGASTVTLTAPAGFQQYEWFTPDFKTLLGTDYTLKISPPPPDDTKYALRITPFPGLGCLDTLYATVKQANQTYNLNIDSSITACADKGVDLTKPEISAGSSADMHYEYYTDPDGQNFLADPKLVLDEGTYYIRGTNDYGCTDIKPVKVHLLPAPKVTVKLPKPVCAPQTIDITTVIGERNDPNYDISYFYDRAGTTPVTNPKSVAKSGTYYIKVIDKSNATLCPYVEAIDVVVSEIPVVQPYAAASCPPLNISISDAFAANNTAGLSYTYFKDAATTIPVDPQNITTSGTYFIKGTNIYGCYNINKIFATVYVVPVFTVVDPLPVVYPSTVNLESAFIPVDGLTYTYWLDSLSTIPVTNHTTISQSGKYYIRGQNTSLCTLTKSIKVTVNPPPEAGLAVSNTFSPNGDGINDLFSPVTQGIVKVNYLKIFNRSGQLMFDTKILFNQWDGTYNGKPVPVGTYYWVFNCTDVYRSRDVTKSGWVTIIR